MLLSSNDRRQYVRYSLQKQLLCFDHQSLIGVSHVADLSEGGACCVSISEVVCPVTWVNSIELYDCENNITVKGLKGKLIHKLAVPACRVKDQVRNHYVFGLTFECTTAARDALRNYLMQIMQEQNASQ